MLHIKELEPKGPHYLIMQHFSRPRYIIHHNSHKSDNFFLSKHTLLCNTVNLRFKALFCVLLLVSTCLYWLYLFWNQISKLKVNWKMYV